MSKRARAAEAAETAEQQKSCTHSHIHPLPPGICLCVCENPAKETAAHSGRSHSLYLSVPPQPRPAPPLAPATVLPRHGLGIPFLTIALSLSIALSAVPSFPSAPTRGPELNPHDLAKPSRPAAPSFRDPRPVLPRPLVQSSSSPPPPSPSATLSLSPGDNGEFSFPFPPFCMPLATASPPIAKQCVPHRVPIPGENA